MITTSFQALKNITESRALNTVIQEAKGCKYLNTAGRWIEISKLERIIRAIFSKIFCCISNAETVCMNRTLTVFRMSCDFISKNPKDWVEVIKQGSEGSMDLEIARKKISILEPTANDPLEDRCMDSIDKCNAASGKLINSMCYANTLFTEVAGKEDAAGDRPPGTDHLNYISGVEDNLDENTEEWHVVFNNQVHKVACKVGTTVAHINRYLASEIDLPNGQEFPILKFFYENKLITLKDRLGGDRNTKQKEADAGQSDNRNASVADTADRNASVRNDSVADTSDKENAADAPNPDGLLTETPKKNAADQPQANADDPKTSVDDNGDDDEVITNQE